MRTLLLTLALATMLAGCETMTEDQCRKAAAADWAERGRADGRNGEPESHLDAHRKACAKAGVAPDERRWRQGWVEGVKAYCVPASAWKAGLDNRSYRGACRDFDEPVFLRWHQLGQDAYKTRSERDARQREIGKLEEQLKKAEKEDERKALREKIRQLDSEMARLRRLLDVQMGGAPR
jgi:flagellar motility protein MotE (MotC chaperone)